MNQTRRQFDWLLFIGRELPIVALAIGWLVRSIRESNILGAILLGGAVASLLTIWNYRSARHSRSGPEQRTEVEAKE